MKKNKGFTLIELLVVIAIIGILAAIVLVSLSGARDRARDARIQADLGQIRSVAEIYYDDYGNYNELNTLSSEYVTLAADVATQGGTMGFATADGTFCAYSSLNAGGFWCVDSTLRTKSYDSSPVGTCAAGKKALCE